MYVWIKDVDDEPRGEYVKYKDLTNKRSQGFSHYSVILENKNLGSVLGGSSEWDGWSALTGDKHTSVDGFKTRRHATEHLLRVAGYREPKLKGFASEELNRLRVLAEFDKEDFEAGQSERSVYVWIAHVESAGGRLPENYTPRDRSTP